VNVAADPPIAPRALLEQLVRFPTVNPPGDEQDCASFIRDLLQSHGIESQLFALDPVRPNLVARITGRGDAPPLLLYGHIDVVPVTGQTWTAPPFDAIERDGFIWGRGTLDDKAGLAMYISALLRARERGFVPAGDVVLAVLADEEVRGEFGARFLVEQHPELFAGVRYALGEAGGFTVHLAGRRIYPIQIAEKQPCVLTVTFRGAGGHAAFRHRGTAMAKLGRALSTLDRRRLPVHVAAPVRLMIGAIADALPAAQRLVLRRLTAPALTNRVLSLAGPLVARNFDPLLHHTVSPVIVRGGVKPGVIPSEVELVLDGRVLPGWTADDLVTELRLLLGREAEIRVDSFDPYPDLLDMGLFETLANALRHQDHEAVPAPYVSMATTDARFFARLGIQTYGFTPMQLSEGYDFATMAHGADERVPVEAAEWGTDAVYRVLETYRSSPQNSPWSPTSLKYAAAAEGSRRT
jgi:acetylornithine deacetylase/succinyl-diaminopimelate desuccinylase-like protein